ncbi:hypothetical protein MTO96_034130 [Rhipicephalus appendiculatus]
MTCTFAERKRYDDDVSYALRSEEKREGLVFLTVAASTAAESFDGSDYQHVPISDNNCTWSVATAILDDAMGAFQRYQRKSTTSQASDCIKGDLQ